MTISSLLKNATALIPARDAETLLAHVLETTREHVLSYPEERISPLTYTTWNTLLNRAAGGEPIAYCTGTAHFYGLPFAVTPDVLIPRPETELLVDAVLERLTIHGQALRIVDVGTGSGCIIISIAHAARQRALHISTCIGIDISPAALNVAQRNALRHDMLSGITFVQSNLLDTLSTPTPLHTVIVTNLPYLPKEDATRPELRHEPRLALDGGSDGLDVLTALFGQLVDAQYPWTLIAEIDPRQKDVLQKKILPFSFPQKKWSIMNDRSNRARVLTIE